jgi:hypothetical protein
VARDLKDLRQQHQSQETVMEDSNNHGRRVPPPFRNNRDHAASAGRTAYPQRAMPNDVTRPYGATPSIGNPTPRPETPNRTGTPGPTPATMPTQRPGSTPQPPTEQPRPNPPRPVSQQRAGSGLNQGEGDKASARVYEQHLHAFIVSGQVAPAARDAANAVDGPEAAELRAAEAAGKRRAKLSMLDRVKGIVRHAAELVTDKVKHLREHDRKN